MAARAPGNAAIDARLSESHAAAGQWILSLLALSLSLDECWFEQHYQMPVSTVRLIKYPPQPADAEFNQIGAGAHTDWGGITILAQDEIGGLEVRNTAGEWLIAKPIPGTFVINLGDLMPAGATASITPICIV